PYRILRAPVVMVLVRCSWWRVLVLCMVAAPSDLRTLVEERELDPVRPLQLDQVVEEGLERAHALVEALDLDLDLRLAGGEHVLGRLQLGQLLRGEVRQARRGI